MENNSLDVSVVYTESMPRDIHSLLPWLNLARRLRSIALNGGSYSVINVTVVSDNSGQPLVWTEPNVRRIEPRANGQALDALLCALK